MWVSPVGNGFHVAKGCHLLTLPLDSALIDDVHHYEVVRWSLFASARPSKPARAILEACFRGNPNLSRLACPIREVLPVVVSCLSS